MVTWLSESSPRVGQWCAPSYRTCHLLEPVYISAAIKRPERSTWSTRFLHSPKWRAKKLQCWKKKKRRISTRTVSESMACNSRTMGNRRSSPTLTSRSPLDLDAFSLAPTDPVRLNHSYCTLQFHKIVSFCTVPFGFLDSISLVKVFSRKKNRSKNSTEFSISVFVNLSEKKKLHFMRVEFQMEQWQQKEMVNHVLSNSCSNNFLFYGMGFCDTRHCSCYSGKTTLLKILAGKHMVGGRDVVRVLNCSAFHDTQLVCSGNLAYLGGSWSKTVGCAVSRWTRQLIFLIQ